MASVIMVLFTSHATAVLADAWSDVTLLTPNLVGASYTMARPAVRADGSATIVGSYFVNSRRAVYLVDGNAAKNMFFATFGNSIQAHDNTSQLSAVRLGADRGVLVAIHLHETQNVLPPENKSHVPNL